MAVKFWVFFSKKNTVMDHSHTTRSINKNREELVLEYNMRHRQHTQLPVTSISWNEISYRVYSITFYTGRGPRWKKKKKVLCNQLAWILQYQSSHLQTTRMEWCWVADQLQVASRYFFFCIPSYISLGFTILGEIFACDPFSSPTIEIVAFYLHGCQ